jgi:hypothetical protein
MGKELEDRIRGIVGLYNFYKHQMNTPQRIAILTLWIEVCVSKEEYEVANALQMELDKVLIGEEEYILLPPSAQFHAPSIDELKNRIGKSIVEIPLKPKIRFVNLSNTGSFTVFNLTFGINFRFIFFNIGFMRK